MEIGASGRVSKLFPSRTIGTILTLLPAGLESSSCGVSVALHWLPPSYTYIYIWQLLPEPLLLSDLFLPFRQRSCLSGTFRVGD